MFVSPCWGGRWGDLVAAACVGAKPGRYVWIDIVAVRQWPGNVADLNFRAVIHRCRAFVVAVAPRGRLSGVVKKMIELSGTFTETSSRTGPQKKCAGKFLTGDLHRRIIFPGGKVDAREVHEARERAEVA